MTKKISEGINNHRFIVLAIIATMIILSVVTAPRLMAKGTVFVDADASGTMDGSEEHPFDKIQDAIDKASEKDRNVFIENGTYKENLELWSDIEMVGEKRGKVVIKAKDDDDPVVLMYDDSEIHNLVLREGKNGVRVKRGAKATIANCDIIDNDRDGIKARESKTKNSQKLEVYDSYIAKNGENGIYTERKKVYLGDNLIEKNDKDGIELAAGSEGKIKNSRIKKNDGVGIKLFVQHSEVDVDGVSIRDNERDGIEIRSNGIDGFINIEDCKFNNNDRWAVARLFTTPYPRTNWDTALLITNPTFIKSTIGHISPVIRTF